MYCAIPRVNGKLSTLLWGRVVGAQSARTLGSEQTSLQAGECLLPTDLQLKITMHCAVFAQGSGTSDSTLAFLLRKHINVRSLHAK
jgi:hypothetical protein